VISPLEATVYTYIYIGIHRRKDAMSRRTQVTLTDRQHAFLIGESVRSGLSLAELVRRAVDTVYRPGSRPRVPGYELSLGLWRRPDAALIGRRAGHRTRRL
jgi:hypothetical protein